MSFYDEQFVNLSTDASKHITYTYIVEESIAMPYAICAVVDNLIYNRGVHYFVKALNKHRIRCAVHYGPSCTMQAPL